MDNLYLCKVEFVGLIEKYNTTDGNSEYNRGIKNGISEGIRALSRALNIPVQFIDDKVNYDKIPM